jgi:hypothetical protein
MPEQVAIERGQRWRSTSGLTLLVRSPYPAGWRCENLNGLSPRTQVCSEAFLRSGFKLLPDDAPTGVADAR